MIADNLRNIKASLPEGVALVAVSKFHPVERLMEAYDAGQRIFAESRPQEFAAKVPLMPSDIEWHFIGHLQTNKLKLVLPYASLVESVDSRHLLESISSWGSAAGKVIDILLEVHISHDEAKQGFSPDEIPALIEALPGLPGVRVRGLMAMASLTGDIDLIDTEFSAVRRLFDDIRTAHPELCDHLNVLSMGMSSDWRIAIRHGATEVRIGTDIFGPREY
ncbi:MAG: YggS family pyridoxal phosphate-dependent enzyme [Bacteroidales bacterium]|nr:YggS family pyridoxal phosphate-dependent enzyme [Bacteroidales bacterium]